MVAGPEVSRKTSAGGWRHRKTLCVMGHMRPWRQARPHWDCAAELVLIAATTGEEADIERATAQMERPVVSHNLVRDSRIAAGAAGSDRL